MAVHLLHYSDVETALDEPDRCGALAGTLDALADDATILVGSGDNTAPGALSIATRGRVALHFFDAVDPDVETFGNHDFDFGPDTARELAATSPQTWLCANASVNGGRFAADVSEPSTVLDTPGGRVGIVGVAHPKTAVMNPAARGVAFADPVPVVRREAKRLRERGADYVVVTSHCGRLDERIARETDVDAVLGGHVHDVHEGTVAGTAVVRPGRAGRYVSEVHLDGTATTAVHQVEDGHVDCDLAETLRGARAENGLDEVATTVGTPIPRTERAATTAGSRIGNLVADALRWRTDADVAISPPGTIRSGDPLAGEVAVGDLVGLAPYEDVLVTVELSGSRLREAFVAVPAGYHADEFRNRYCSHVSGARLVWDDAAGELREATVGGEPVDPDRTYRVAVADYLVETDHVTDAFEHDDVVEEHGRACDVIVDYAREIGLEGGTDRRVERPTL